MQRQSNPHFIKLFHIYCRSSTPGTSSFIRHNTSENLVEIVVYSAFLATLFFRRGNYGYGYRGIPWRKPLEKNLLFGLAHFLLHPRRGSLGKFGAVLEAELLFYLLPVILNRLDAQVKFLGDLPGALPIPDGLEHFELPVAEDARRRGQHFHLPVNLFLE